MTREEQIDWLCLLREDLNNGVIFTPWNKEFTEALTGLLDPQLCEDAKKYFNIIRDISQTCDLPYSFVDKKIKETIKELNALKKEPCTDAISRQAALDAIEKAQYSRDFCKEHHIDYSISMEMVRIVLHDLPPVTPKQSNAKCKWIKYNYRTICPKEHDVNEPYWKIPEDRKDVLKFCPYCGLEIEMDVPDNNVGEMEVSRNG